MCVLVGRCTSVCVCWWGGVLVCVCVCAQFMAITGGDCSPGTGDIPSHHWRLLVANLELLYGFVANC